MIERVDPFIGTAVTELPTPTGLAATWWWPKPQVGNTHPGATYPLGMVSACAYSGAYPTGYGSYDLTTEGVPPTIHDRPLASGFTHFQQSGTGAIRKYYNYFRVTPMTEPLDVLGRTWDLTDEQATPGFYAATLDSGIRAEITVGPKSAVHRYTFPRHKNARIVIDFSLGGLSIPYGSTIPLRAHLQSIGPGVAQGEIVVEGAPLAVHVECDAPHWRQMLWYDRRLMPGGTRLDFDHIRPTTLRSFGLMWAGPAEPGQTIELRFGFSLRGVDQARENLVRDCGIGPARFGPRRDRTAKAWKKHLQTIRVDTPSEARQTVFSTALYHSLIKPCLAPDESPFWPTDGPFVFDLSTMWDIYRTQLPLVTTLMPDRAVELANALLTICEEEGNFPIGYRMARGSDRFSRQGSALAQTFLADLCQLGVDGIDWDWALVHMHNDLRRTYGEDFLLHGEAHPISHTLDLAFGYWCTAKVARRVGDLALAEEFEELASQWVNAFDVTSGLLKDSTFYEGGKWNYSFRLLHDMAGRIDLAGGDEAFVGLLDRFFGFGAFPVTQPGLRTGIRGDGGRLRARPLRGPEQRTRHGGAVGLLLRGAPRPHRRDRARRHPSSVRHRTRRPARQRRFGRAELLVRLGVARAVPGRGPEPVPHRRPLVRRVAHPGDRWRRGHHRDARLRGAAPRRARAVRAVGRVQRRTAAPHLAPRQRGAPRRKPVHRTRPRTGRLGHT